jgi:hypothetical protein
MAMTPEELKQIETRHRMIHHGIYCGLCVMCHQRWPCDAARLAEALREAWANAWTAEDGEADRLLGRELELRAAPAIGERIHQDRASAPDDLIICTVEELARAITATWQMQRQKDPATPLDRAAAIAARLREVREG